MNSQNNEEQIIGDYFNVFKGTLLSIGENDGQVMSNVFKLLSDGWQGTLVEPNYECFDRLINLWKKREDIQCLQLAIGKENMEGVLLKNGELYGGTGLVSTLDPKGMEKWKEVTTFEPQICTVVDYATLIKMSMYKTFDFISIDAENADWDILQQIDLAYTRCLCIEWNSIPELKEKFINYCEGFKVIGLNGENIIFAR
jgi:FkbM family methyltransferase